MAHAGLQASKTRCCCGHTLKTSKAIDGMCERLGVVGVSVNWRFWRISRVELHALALAFLEALGRAFEGPDGLRDSATLDTTVDGACREAWTFSISSSSFSHRSILSVLVQLMRSCW